MTLEVGNLFLRTTQGAVSAASAPTCTPFLSGVAIGPDFQMGFCDVTSDADVIALSSAQSNNAANYWPPYVSGKRMASVQNVTLTSDAAAANGTRYLQLLDSGGASDAGTGGWENLTVPFPVDLYGDLWLRVVVSNFLTGSDTMGFVSPNYFQGLGFSGYTTPNALYASNYMGATGAFTTPLLTSIAATDVIELIFHVQSSNWVDQGTYFTVDTTWDLFARNHTTSATGSMLGLTGSIQSDKQNSSSTGATSPWMLQFPAEMLSDGTTRIHAWEFVDGSVHTHPFGF